MLQRNKQFFWLTLKDFWLANWTTTLGRINMSCWIWRDKTHETSDITRTRVEKCQITEVKICIFVNQGKYQRFLSKQHKFKGIAHLWLYKILEYSQYIICSGQRSALSQFVEPDRWASGGNKRNIAEAAAAITCKFSSGYVQSLYFCI